MSDKRGARRRAPCERWARVGKGWRMPRAVWQRGPVSGSAPHRHRHKPVRVPRTPDRHRGPCGNRADPDLAADDPKMAEISTYANYRIRYIIDISAASGETPGRGSLKTHASITYYSTFWHRSKFLPHSQDRGPPRLAGTSNANRKPPRRPIILTANRSRAVGLPGAKRMVF